MIKNEPLVTVILPTYRRNYDDFLKKAIESVLSQTYKNFEFFIVDDGSQDGSSDLIKKYVNDDRLQYLRFDKNIGLPAYVILQAYLKSKGQYISFIFDDCQWRSEHLEKHINIIQSKKDIFCTYSKCEMHFKDSISILGKPFSQIDLDNGLNFIPNVSVVLNRKIIEDIGWYDPNIILKRFCDLDLWIRVSKKYEFYFVDDVTADEYGVMLDDSLGNSVGIDLGLLKSYMNKDRNDKLLPNKIKLEDSYRFNGKNNKENECFKILLLEHFIKSFDIEGILNMDINHDLIDKEIAIVKNQHLSYSYVNILLNLKMLLSEEKKKTKLATENHLIALRIADERMLYIQEFEKSKVNILNIFRVIIKKIFLKMLSKKK